MIAVGWEVAPSHPNLSEFRKEVALMSAQFLALGIWLLSVLISIVVIVVTTRVFRRVLKMGLMDCEQWRVLGAHLGRAWAAAVALMSTSIAAVLVVSPLSSTVQHMLLGLSLCLGIMAALIAVISARMNS